MILYYYKKIVVLKMLINDGLIISLKGKLVLIDFYNIVIELVSDGILNK